MSTLLTVLEYLGLFVAATAIGFRLPTRRHGEDDLDDLS